MPILLSYNKMISMLQVIVTMLGVMSVLVLSYVSIANAQRDSIDSLASNFSKDLKSRIDNLIADKFNSTGNFLNSSTIITNDSNHTSSQIIISKNKVMSTMTSRNESTSGSSMIKDKVTIINGVCHSEKVGGNGDDILTSSGNCDDELTGGPGADKFTCGQGNDTVRDYNPEEGDVILDRENCEKIL